jgi:hypothetical protein
MISLEDRQPGYEAAQLHEAWKAAHAKRNDRGPQAA